MLGLFVGLTVARLHLEQSPASALFRNTVCLWAARASARFGMTRDEHAKSKSSDVSGLQFYS